MVQVHFVGYRNGERVSQRDESVVTDTMHNNAQSLYAREIDETIKYGTAGKVQGFIGEPIQGVGGTIGSVYVPSGYLVLVSDAQFYFYA